MKELLLPLSAAFLAAAVPATASPPAAGSATAQTPAQVRIPFASFGAIRNFRPQGDDVVYLQGSHRRWYRAELNGPCINLPAALRIGFDTRFNGNTLDNSSTLIVEGERCRIASLTLADGPPPRRPRR
ncbi:MAG TPA: DUF6491 family protein [Allosphingosinicella sp.]|nr:DUF6491 family protein [Allosphingosinicella sp.]